MTIAIRWRPFYRRSVVSTVERLLAANQLRTTNLFDAVPTRFVIGAELRDVDPELSTLENLNDAADYARALARAGIVATCHKPD